ncbi:hypothetical protein [Pseudomonas sp. OIL-1]|uniref:hypothetical protein n=1 Tax=Pseudomonas sp. OIL-1 TaxID=2706126 RepID=UPI0013A7A861|nr:hypothetical protein [Pseudomonas sp. OIL-1]QIB51183.1 hypothetical protein G3M63_09060 [Pseudomonas sp. OIL-1]
MRLQKLAWIVGSASEPGARLLTGYGAAVIAMDNGWNVTLTPLSDSQKKRQQI